MANVERPAKSPTIPIARETKLAAAAVARCGLVTAQFRIGSGRVADPCAALDAKVGVDRGGAGSDIQRKAHGI